MLETSTALNGASVPQAPASTDRPAGRRAQETVNALAALLAQRPIVTVRGAGALLGRHHLKISYAVHYVGYYVSRGPWEGTIVRYGVDPRSDPSYRFYQTVKINFLDVQEVNATLETRGHTGLAHIFDGKTKTLTDVSKYWQLCDLTEPFLQKLVTLAAPRTQCHDKGWGWYANGALCKIKTLLREKFLEIVNGQRPLSDADYDTLERLPSEIVTASQCELDRMHSRYVRQLAESIAIEAMRGPFRSDKPTRMQSSAAPKATTPANSVAGVAQGEDAGASASDDEQSSAETDDESSEDSDAEVGAGGDEA